MTKKAAQKEESMKKKLTASVLAVASVLSMSTGMVFADETTAEVPEIEMADAPLFDTILVNDDLATTKKELDKELAKFLG